MKKRNIVPLSLKEQQILWNALPHTSDHFAGCLRLCLGMPVIICHNDATELCITNGQEGTMAGWTTLVGSCNQLMLDTLFVKLVKPPHEVNIPGLPSDTVPIPYTIKDIIRTLPGDQTIQLHRKQIHILPNFAMTDYASQGKTREYNVVDLQHCQTHQSYYTALSRSATAKGTAIIQGFDAIKITGGASGWLCKEFRELELLNDITLMQYEEKLPQHIIEHRRNTLITEFRKWKGLQYMPNHLQSKYNIFFFFHGQQ